MADEGQQPVIIKRVKKAAHGHHGGAWKLAYADFVTAMMAFFLLLWLLNAVTEEQLQGIADYFAPTTVSQSNNGAGGMLGGLTIGKGAETSNSSAPAIALSLPPPTIGEGGEAFTSPKEGMSDQQLEGLSDKPNEQPGTGLAKSGEGKPKEADQQAKAVQELTPAQVSEQQLEQAQAEKEQQQFEKAQQALKQAINSIPELAKLANSLLVDNTPEGLRIQIVDQEGLAMFPSGSADMFGHTRALLELVGRVIKQLPEPISISGHTDSVPFAGQTNYTNWELSADRALAARRVLTGEGGVPAQRVQRVVGQADMEPLLPNDPTNPRNRRLTIVLLRQNPGVTGPATVGVTSAQMKSGQLPSELKPAAAPSPTATTPAAAPLTPAPAATGTAPAPKQ